jgi:hypothetical protein
MLAMAVLVTAAAVPAEIQAHYRDHNFVCAFSTTSERRLMVVTRRPPPNERMARVADAIERLEGRVAEIDPGIVAWASPPLEVVLRQDLLRIAAFEADQDGGEAWVHLESLHLDPPASATLVAKYDDLTRGGRESALDDLLAATGRPLRVTLEVHRWRRVGGAWQRDRATVHLLDAPGRR